MPVTHRPLPGSRDLKRRLVLSLITLAGAGLLAPVTRAQEVAIPTLVTVRTDRPLAVYSVREPASFLIAVRKGGLRAAGEKATVRLTNDGMPMGEAQTVTLDERGMAEVKGTLGAPGFLRCAVTFGEGAAAVTTLGGAAFDPEGIRPVTKLPADFDQFWTAQKAELAKIPIDAKLTKVDRYSDETSDSYKVNLANIDGTRVYGWISVPKKQGPLPAVLTVPGAGVYPQGPNTELAKLGALSMSISIHNMDVDLPAQAYTDANNGPLRGYPHQNRTDREKFYYRRVILGCVRALDYLTSRPEWNRKHLVVQGGSQGGALSLITGGVDPRVTAIAPNVAAMCDHAGYTAGKVSGWPQVGSGAPDAEKAAVAKVSAYYDAVNFARRFKGPSLHGVGFIDTVCPPTTVYAAYNVLPAPKEMVQSPLMGHSTDPRFTARRNEFLKAHWASDPR